MTFKIFVTTGSSLEFDCLIEFIDKLNKNKKYNIICQIGKGKYIPINCNYFDFKSDIFKYYKWADLIITHTGGTTLSEICQLNKKSIAISNPKGMKGIYEIAIKFDKAGYLKYLSYNDINKLEKLIENNLNNNVKFKKYKLVKQKIGKEIIKFLKI